MGQQVAVPTYPYIHKPRPFEEMSDPGDSAVGNGDNGHGGENPYTFANGYDDGDVFDDENGYEGDREDSGEHGLNGHDGENGENGGENITQGTVPLFATIDALSSHTDGVINLRVLTSN